MVATGEDVPVFNPAEDLATEDQTKASLEAKTVAELKDLAKNFEIDLGEATKKADIINVILPQIITSEKAEELGIE